MAMGCAGMLAAGEPRTFYVNNRTGADANDGLAATQQGDSGPLATIMEAVRKCDPGSLITIANTGLDYREGVNIEGFKKGLAERPLVINGNGCTVNGLVVVAAERWTKLKDDIYWFENRLPNGKFGIMPHSNWLASWKHQGWFDHELAPNIFFVDGRPAPHVKSLEQIPPGGYFYDTLAEPRRIYFRLPAGMTKLEEVKTEFPLNLGVYISDDYVVVRNLRSIYSADDGFAGFWGVGVVFQNIYGGYNADQGISLHATSVTLIDGGVFERNGGCGIVDVHSSTTIYRNCVIRHNYPAGAQVSGLAHQFLNCRFYGNFDNQLSNCYQSNLGLVNCLIDGRGTDNGIVMENGRLDRCTVVNCKTGLLVLKSATVKNSVFSACQDQLIVVRSGALPDFCLSKTLLNLGKATFGDKQVADPAGWESLAPEVKWATGVIIAAPALSGPDYVVPEDSPYRTAADYGMSLGAILSAEREWRGESGTASDTPHP